MPNVGNSIPRDCQSLNNRFSLPYLSAVPSMTLEISNEGATDTYIKIEMRLRGRPLGWFQILLLGLAFAIRSDSNPQTVRRLCIACHQGSFRCRPVSDYIVSLYLLLVFCLFFGNAHVRVVFTSSCLVFFFFLRRAQVSSLITVWNCWCQSNNSCFPDAWSQRPHRVS